MPAPHQAGCPSYRPTNNVKALKCYAYHPHNPILIYCKEPNVKKTEKVTDTDNKNWDAEKKQSKMNL